MAGTASREPRSVPGLLAETVRLYRRFPLLFPSLAAGVLVPYQLLVLGLTDTNAFSRGSLGFFAFTLLSVADWCVVQPLVSALHVHAVADVEEGRTPRAGDVARRGLRVLPVVAAAAIMSGLGIFAGMLCLAVPGVYLWLRWQVVAQAAAIEPGGWTQALGRSWSLTERNALRVLFFLLSVAAISVGPGFLIGRVLRGSNSALAFVVGVAFQIVFVSFTALATALLYYDLRARRQLLGEAYAAGAAPPTGPESAVAGHSSDPRDYSDDTRPKGWYVDPSSPGRIRYWSLDPPGWRGSARTPRKLRREWKASRPK
jgi:hypothetical protein